MSETSEPIAPPAPLVPDDERADLVDLVIAAVTLEVGADSAGRDAERVERAVRAAMETAEARLDRVEGWDLDTIPARVMKGLVELGSLYLKRASSSFGVAGYDDADPQGIRAEGAILASMVAGLQGRLGVA